MSRVTPTLPPRERLRRAGTAAWALVGVSILAGAAIWSLYEGRHRADGVPLMYGRRIFTDWAAHVGEGG